MQDFLRKIKLIDNLTVELEIQKADFIKAFLQHVDQAGTGLFSDTFDAFSSGKNEFKGTINDDGFVIKRRRRFFDRSAGFARGFGTFTQRGNKLIIDTEIRGFTRFMYFFFGFLLLIYAVAISSLLLTVKPDEIYFIFPFILFHAAFMFGLFYFIMRRSVSRLKYELEREFYFWIKNNFIYFFRKKILMGTPVSEKFSRIRFSK